MGKLNYSKRSPNNLSVGDLLENKEGLSFEIIEYLGSRKVKCKFVGTGYETGYMQAGNVVRGNLKDLLYPSVESVGYLGEGDAPLTRGRITHPIHLAWRKMIIRCYSDNYHKTRPTYKGCTVVEEWHNYQKFYSWTKDKYKKDFQLDKDILFKGNKVYSPTTCSFVPREINSLVTDNKVKRGDSPLGVSKRKKKGTSEFNGLFTVACNSPSGLIYLGRFTCEVEAFNRYKEFKEELLRIFGETYYERGLISKEVSEALINRVILITD